MTEYSSDAADAAAATAVIAAGRDRETVVRDFSKSELFDRTFAEGMALVEETAAYLDGDGRRESRLLSRAASLAYAAESMKLTTRLMQIASWLLVQRAVREGDMTPAAAAEPRYRLADRKPETQPTHADLPIALVEYLVRADTLHDRVLHLDRRMYLDAVEETPVNPVQSHLDRLTAAFGN
jgi:regulator of CtrA degradation